MEQQQTSPLPKNKEVETVQMLTFIEAFTRLLTGERITRVEWGSVENYGHIKDDYVMIHRDGKNYAWTITNGDYLNNDWYVL